MKATKETDQAKDKTKETKKTNSNKRIEELETLILLMDKKIISLEKDMKAMKKVHDRIRMRMGV